MKKQVVIIGAGASGLTAAIWAAKKGAEVTVLEHMDRVGKKILSTGNGRCNLTNEYMTEQCYRCSQPAFPMKVIEKFPVSKTLSWFSDMGVEVKNRQGYYYPNSDQASSVLDSLRMEAEHRKVKIVCQCHVKAIKKEKGRFKINTDQGDFFGHSLVLAAGSKAAPATGSDGSGYELAKGLGHSLIKPLPALVQLRCQGNYYKQLAGIRTDVRIVLWADKKAVAEETGELQLTDYGISGIPVFQISRFAAKALDEKKRVTAVIDFLPAKSWKETKALLYKRREQLSYRQAEDFLTGLLNKKLAQVLLKLSGIQATLTAQISDKQLAALLKNIKEYEAYITSTNPFANAQVCMGGVSVKEVNPETMESRIFPGLYLAGELLDVDGICGGYNLQWAWSSGYVAGIHAGE